MHPIVSRFNLYVGTVAIQRRESIGIWYQATMPEAIEEITYSTVIAGYPGPASITIDGYVSGEDFQTLYGHAPRRQMVELGMCDGKSLILSGAILTSVNFANFDAENPLMRAEITLCADTIIQRDRGCSLDYLPTTDEVLEGVLRSEGLSPMEVFEALTGRKT